MPKIKTVKGVKSRFRVTRNGKVIAHRPGRRHLLVGKRSKTKRGLRRTRTISRTEERKIIALMPYR